MKKVYHVGDMKGKDKKTYHVYYNVKKDSFTCTDQNGKEITLTPKIHSHIARKFNLNRSVYLALHYLKKWIFTSFFVVAGMGSIHYRHVLFDLPEIIDISRSHDPERLKEKVVEYINKKDNLTFAQKEYLCNTFSLYLEDYGDCYEFMASLNMLNNFKSVDIKYKELRESGTTGTYSRFFNEIELFTDISNL